MTHKHYLEEIKKLQSELDDKLLNLMKEFVRSNNPYKKGDIVTDRMGGILIESMSYSWGSLNNKPCAVYYGIELKKDGTPNKRGTKRNVYQSNIISNN